MSLKDCIDRLHQAGEITLEEAQALKKRYDALARIALAPKQIRDEMLADLEAARDEKIKRAKLTEERRPILLGNLVTHVDASGHRNSIEALAWTVEHDGQARFESLQTRYRQVQADIFSRIAKVSHEFQLKAKLSGDLMRRMPHVAPTMLDWVRELGGTKTNNPKAAELAAITQDVLEYTRQRFNAAGGNIGKLERYILPQHHSRDALLNAGPLKWYEFIKDLLDLDAMKHPKTGRKFTQDELREILIGSDRESQRNSIYSLITSDGMSNMEPTGAIMGKGALFKRYADHRFLHFKDADSWFKYQKAFGEGDPYAALTAHLGKMSRDIALMEYFGPNPQSMWQYLVNVVTHEAATALPNQSIRKAYLERLAQLMPEQAFAENLQPQMDKILGQISVQRDIIISKGWEHSVDYDPEAVKAANESLVSLRKQYDSLADQVRKILSDAQTARTADQVEEIERLLKSMPSESIAVGGVRDPKSYADGWIRTSTNMFDHFRGSANIPEGRMLAAFGRTTRNLTVASKLPAAYLSAQSDFGFSRQSRQLAGMSDDHFLKKTITGYINAFLPGGRQAAAEAGIIAEAQLHTMHREARFAAGMNATGISGYLADRTLAWSFLKPHTQAMKDAIGLEYSMHMAKMSKVSWGALPDRMRKALESQGWNDYTWRLMNRVPTKPVGFGWFSKGIPIIHIDDLLRFDEANVAAGLYSIDQGVAAKYIGTLGRVSKQAVPEPGLRAKAFMMEDSRPGTVMGELRRYGFQFKGFAIGSGFLYGPHAFRKYREGDVVGGFRYAGSLMFYLMFLGAIVVQLKEMAAGRDPRPMDDEKFWGAAILQSGGLGIYGDFLMADANRYGAGVESTLSGPVIGSFLNPLYKLTVGNLQESIDPDKEKTNIGREAVRFARGFNPFFNTWYTRPLWERMIFDPIEEAVDPDAHRARRRMMRKRKKDFGNDFWWAPGEMAPSRPPNVNNAIGDLSSAAGVAPGAGGTALASAPSAPVAVAEAQPEQQAPVQLAQADVPRGTSVPQPTQNNRRKAKGRSPGRIPVV